MAVALLLLSGSTLEPRHELTPGEPLERLVDRLETGERVQPLRPLVQLTRRLRAAEQEDAQDGGLRRIESERLVEELPILRRATARAAREPRPAAAGELLERFVDLPFLELENRLAIRRLIAGEAERVERQGVLIRGRALLLEQAAEHPELDGIGVVHALSVRRRPVPRRSRGRDVASVALTVEMPIRWSYRVADRFLAGAYPGARDPSQAADRLASIHDHGITLFVDLTHPADVLEPYERLLGSAAGRVSHPIVDLGTPTIPQMSRILDTVDGSLELEASVYLHCWGGIGRTGTVVGCWLVRHGLDGGRPLERLAELRRHVSDPSVASPETDAQRAMVETWKRGR